MVFKSDNVRNSYNNSYNDLESKMKAKTFFVSTEEVSGVVYSLPEQIDTCDNSFIFNHCFRPIR